MPSFKTVNRWDLCLCVLLVAHDSFVWRISWEASLIRMGVSAAVMLAALMRVDETVHIWDSPYSCCLVCVVRRIHVLALHEVSCWQRYFVISFLLHSRRFAFFLAGMLYFYVQVRTVRTSSQLWYGGTLLDRNVMFLCLGMSCSDYIGFCTRVRFGQNQGETLFSILFRSLSVTIKTVNILRAHGVRLSWAWTVQSWWFLSIFVLCASLGQCPCAARKVAA